MRKNNVLKEKSFSFAHKIINLYKRLIEGKEFALSKQVLPSGPTIGSLIKESENAASTKDFLNKLNIALKQADETQYWLELLHQSEYIRGGEFETLSKHCNEVVSMLIASVITIKARLNSPL